MKFASIITGSGAYIPNEICKNDAFKSSTFYDATGAPITADASVVIDKFRSITGINERRYAPAHINASDMAAAAGWQALTDSSIDPETLDQIVVAHNFGDVTHGTVQSQNVPALANNVKHILGISRPECIAYDVLVGCPGWLHTVIQSHAWFTAGMARKVLLIGTETLSRVIDASDRDSMIFSDGAGAIVLEYKPATNGAAGILGCSAQSHSTEEADYINMGRSYKQNGSDTLFIKMKGRKVYEYALKHVPLAMKECLDKSGVHISEVHKILIHQANEKMDEEIVKRLYNLYAATPPADIMPMSIQWLGNSSVATIPTLYHLIRSNKIAGHAISDGDIILFASVGAGMNINAVCYRA
ncbi:3-oxoacyl-ACP synthase III family protein [Niabella drilacis]|uniref:3-oxoacyl-[acyl-carrier-protein] synthase-3 n=1 Tax=Niabella drilacis (strain DSM 25811 / CCM 8410 / CCUG 62505 / LMG 26954 / E90) TaxID=1285928 RepID=A0A1G6PJD3_NIADE|nr:3-oxoacyl-[acyl-carrier-protein] synthase III C-terminal domain-containing protein [Niabella drilacis]SDC80330.1 3-oxoacyl-[acyl-carrier-protein] synthase-3 [Niabella drilacis]